MTVLLDCSPVAVDDDGNKDLEPPTKGETKIQNNFFPRLLLLSSNGVTPFNVAGIKSTLSVEDERAANPEPVKPPPGEFLLFSL